MLLARIIVLLRVPTIGRIAASETSLRLPSQYCLQRDAVDFCFRL